VRLRRQKLWVLPKGKLYPGERALTEFRGFDLRVENLCAPSG